MGRPEVVYPGVPIEVAFLQRPNRFLAEVRPVRGGPSMAVHVPNPGRMTELLLPGRTRGFVVPSRAVGRATAGTLVAVRHGRTLVSIDTLAANRIVGRALSERVVPGLPREGWRAEVPYGHHHRFDFARVDPRRGRLTHLLEVKSSNLRIGPYGSFPDAPTERGARHLELLADASRRGIRSEVLFAIQRGDVRAFTPNRPMDPDFARAFDRARSAGVRMRAFRLRIHADRVGWGPEIPVLASARENLFKRVGPIAQR